MPDASAMPRHPSGFGRRSDRISISVPIQVQGIDSKGKPFNEKTHTLVISRYGAVIVLARPLASGQEFAIRCIGTGREAKSRVVGQVGGSAAGYLYGVEILDSDVNLWEINFPPATESEMAAGRLLLECSRCQACDVAYLNIGEMEIFQRNQRLSRPCQPCNDVTVWSEALLRKQLVEPAKLPVDPLVGQTLPPVPQRVEDERVDPRVDLSLTGCIQTNQYGEDIVLTENVSEGGVCFRSRNRYAGGTLVGAAIPYLQGRANVFVQARITWSKYRSAEGLTAYGLSYIHARRRARRVKPATLITIGFIGSGIRTTGKLVNVSMTGMLVRCAEQLEAGAVVRLGIEMGHETIRIAATARRSAPGVGTAFEFTQMSHRDRALLRRLILGLEKQWGH